MITLVLLSGGLDSAVLAAHEAQTARVLPVYVSVGLAWEDAEVAMVERLLAAPAYAGASIRSRASRSRCAMSISPSHWAIRGVPPAYDTPDEDVYLDRAQLVLLTKAGVVAAKAKAPIASRSVRWRAIHFRTRGRRFSRRWRRRCRSASITGSRSRRRFWSGKRKT